jgi:hypothetical protein
MVQTQRWAVLSVVLALLSIAAFAPSAQGAECPPNCFGLHNVDVVFTGEGGEDLTQAGPPQGEILTQAGVHPFAMTTSFRVNGEETEQGGELPFEAIRDVLFSQMPGFAAAPTAVPVCSTADFLTNVGGASNCPDSAAVGTVKVQLAGKAGKAEFYGAVYNLEPAPGIASKLGFWISEVPVTIDARLGEDPPYPVIAGPTNTSQLVEAMGAVFTLWGVPADPAHDPLRGRCLSQATGGSLGQCPVNIQVTPFITMPRNCDGPLATTYEAVSWLGTEAVGSVLSHDESGNPQGMTGCGSLAFDPQISAQPTSKAATSPTGLDFSLDVQDEGLTSSKEGAVAGSDIEKAVVTLPEGFTANPSLAEGLEVCSEADLARETAFSEPGAGCPNAAKVGSVEIETPLLEGKLLKGAVYIAKPYENPFNSLLALYIVIKNPELGISVVQAAKVTPDPLTGQLLTTTEEMPQLPFSHFRLHFREGGRSPLISPPTCGSHEVKAVLYPSSGNPPVTTFSAFQIISGPNGGPCPPGGVAPFHPGFEAGSLNNNAGSYSPFNMRLTRRDGEQDMTRFSAVLPPGVVGKIAGVSKCSEADIAQAKSRTGPHGGQEELNAPSCPASSRIGRTLAGAGVGSQLTYVPGSLYLAGPIGGDPLSVVSITPALAGPFDAGAVVVRVALTLNPETAEVEADGSHSDPIPHILKGIPLNVRDLRVYADKPEFTINPTNCEPSSARATLFGSFLNVFDPADDVPAGLSSRYQAANCAALGFKPKLQIKLKGGTKRGGHPALRATVTPRPGDANFSAAVVTLPHSAFLDQAHIRTICTRVQFAEGAGNGSACPEGSIYGQARANSPLLDETLEGPVFLRSSSHNLPDLVIALHGLVNINLASRIDSRKGGIRSTFEDIPDAPVSRFVLEMQGGRKGLIVNSTNLCASTNRARAKLTGQNGRIDNVKPALRAAKCTRRGKAKRAALSAARGVGR